MARSGLGLGRRDHRLRLILLVAEEPLTCVLMCLDDVVKGVVARVVTPTLATDA